MNDECERVGEAFFVLLKSCEDFFFVISKVHLLLALFL